MTEKAIKTFGPFIAKTEPVSGIDGAYWVTISSDSLDRDEEVVLPSALAKHLDGFMAHNILVSSHDYHDLRKQIGEVPDLEISRNRTRARVEYYVGQGNDEADWGAFLASRGKAAYSIGFIPHEYEDKQIDGKTVRHYTDAELMEVSHVILGSNRDALVDARSKGLSPELDELVTEIIDEMPEGKPVDVTEDYIRVRVRDPGEFDPNAFGEDEKFRTIDIDKDKGIKAVIGKLKGETSTTVQSYLFDKDKWSKEDAVAWVEEHEKDIVGETKEIEPDIETPPTETIVEQPIDNTAPADKPTESDNPESNQPGDADTNLDAELDPIIDDVLEIARELLEELTDE